MDIVLAWITNNYSLTALILLGAFALSIIVFIVVIIRLNRMNKKYRQLLKGSEGKNLEEILLGNAKLLEQVLFKLDLADERLKGVEHVATNSIQQIGVVRYNAFKDMGGDLSYSVALLDRKGDGVVLSSIFSREDARTYAKPIKNGKSPHQLSEEEVQAIQQVAKPVQPKVY